MLTINIVGMCLVIVAATNISTIVRKHSMKSDGKTYSMVKYAAVSAITAVVFSLIFILFNVNANNGSKLLYYASATFIILLYCISFALAKKKIVFEDECVVIKSIKGNKRIQYTDIINCRLKDNRSLLIQTSTHTSKVTDVFPTDEFVKILKKKNVKVERESKLNSFEIYYPLDGKIALLILYYGGGIACVAGIIYLIYSSLINIWAFVFLALVAVAAIFKGVDSQKKRIIVKGNEILSKSLLQTRNISFDDVKLAKKITDEKGYQALTLYNSDNKKMLEVGEYLINSEKFEQVLKSRNIVIK